MFEAILRALLVSGAGAARRLAVRVLALAVGMALLLTAVIFALLAFYFSLADVMARWQAAAIIAATLTAIGGSTVWLTTRFRHRHPRLPAGDPGRLSALTELGTTIGRDLSTNLTPTHVVLLAVIAGFILGRRK
jgi:hypothetical protein